MAREHDGPAVGRLSGEHRPQRLHSQRIQSTEGFIEHQQIGIEHQRRRQLHTLLVPVRQLLQPGLRSIRQAELLEPPVCRRHRLPGRHAVELTEVDELIQHLHPRIEPALLGHVAETVSCRFPHRRAVPGHPPGIERHEAEHRAHGGGLPGPVRTEESQDPARPHSKAAAVQGHHITVPLRQVLELEHPGEVTA